jgi:hypothetical protein
MLNFSITRETAILIHPYNFEASKTKTDGERYRMHENPSLLLKYLAVIWVRVGRDMWLKRWNSKINIHI